VIYTGRSDSFVKPVVEVFERETGIRVILHSGNSTALLNKLMLEGARTDADIFISNDAGNLQMGSERKLFAPVAAAVAAQIPANYRAADNTWLGLSARARVLVINTEAEDVGFVQSVFDLADPRLANRIAVTNSSNESFVAGVTVYLEQAGAGKTDSWLRGVKTNMGRDAFNKHSGVVSAVASGSKAVGLVNHYYIYRHLESRPDAPIRMLIPDQGAGGMGVAWNVAGAAISRHSKQQDAAQKFMAFLVSDQGQELFARVNQEYPVRPEVAAAPDLPPQQSFKVADVPLSKLGTRRGVTLDLIEKVGMH
jgi:iron(III) transport system substrate-binding protein